jgi:hypothetical protein
MRPPTVSIGPTGQPGDRQALHRMQDMLTQHADLQDVLRRFFADPIHGRAIRDDLRAGFSTLPIWMQEFLRRLLDLAAQGTAMTAAAYKEVIAASPRDRLDLFLATANRVARR